MIFITLAKIEQETIIIFNQEEDLATIETPVKALQKELQKLGAKEIQSRRHTFEGITYKTFEFPKEWIQYQNN